MRFATADVLGISTGRLLGDIGGIYKVASFLLGRNVYTHELAFYGHQMRNAIKAALPDLPGETDAEHVDGQNFSEYLAVWRKRFGSEIDLPDSLRDCLADDKNALETLSKMVPPEKIIIIKTER